METAAKKKNNIHHRLSTNSRMSSTPRIMQSDQFLGLANLSQSSHVLNDSKQFVKLPNSSFSENLLINSRLDETNYSQNSLRDSIKQFDSNLMDVTRNMVDDTEPVYATYINVFSEFNKVLSENMYNDLIDLINFYEKVCLDHEIYINKLLKSLQDGTKMQTALHMFKLLKLEKQTWRLLGCLYKDRLESEENSQNDLIDQSDSNWKSEKKLVQDYLASDSQVRQAQIVVDWLEKNASENLDSVAETLDQYIGGVMWENSLYCLKMNKERGDISDGKYITEMDPDAPTRQKKTMRNLDVEDEAKLLYAVQALIRAGQIHQAQDICVNHGQAWRAATFEGWRLYHDPFYASDCPERLMIEGNPTRKLWKSTCWTLSQNDDYSLKEKAIYGALSGNLTAMLNDSSNWQDHVWSHYKTLVDVSVEKKLHSTFNINIPIQRRCLLKSSDAGSLPDQFWQQNVHLNEQEKIFDEIAASHNEEVRTQAKHPFHFSQRCIIINSINRLVTEMIHWNDADDFDPHILRFCVHLLLVLRSLRLDVDEDNFNDLMYKYVTFLSQDPRTSPLVANYSSSLPANLQIQSYVDLLEPIEDPHLRKEFFELGMNAELDMSEITKRVVDRIRSSSESCLIGSLTESKVDDYEVDISIDDRKIIFSIEWLIFTPSQRVEAVRQCNSIMRTFLGAGKYRAASEVCHQLPSDSIDVIYRDWQSKYDSEDLPPAYDNAIRENLSLIAYLEAHIAFKNWFQHLYSEKPKLSSEGVVSSTDISFKPITGNVSILNTVATEHKQMKYENQLRDWNNRLATLCKIVKEKIYNVLLFPDGGWLVDKYEVEDDPSDQTRKHQMDLLRQLSIPLLCNLLLSVIENMDDKEEACCELVNIVADEHKDILKLFSKAEGKKFVLRVQAIMIDYM